MKDYSMFTLVSWTLDEVEKEIEKNYGQIQDAFNSYDGKKWERLILLNRELRELRDGIKEDLHEIEGIIHHFTTDIFLSDENEEVNAVIFDFMCHSLDLDKDALHHQLEGGLF